jgi:hypothetical protein
MDYNPTPVLVGLQAGGLSGLDQEVDGSIPVRVAEHLNALVGDLLHRLDDDLGREQRLAAPVLLAVGSLGKQRLGPEGGLALRRSVQGELDPPELQAVLVDAEGIRSLLGQLHRAALKVRGVLLDQCGNFHNQRQRHDIQVEQTLGAALAQERQVLGVGRALGAGGDACAGVDLLGGIEGVEQLPLARLGHVGEDGQEGGFHDEAGRRVGSLQRLMMPPGGVLVLSS